MLLLEGAVSTCMVTGDPQSYAEAKSLAASLLRPRTS
jgi:hypothetical protein